MEHVTGPIQKVDIVIVMIKCIELYLLCIVVTVDVAVFTFSFVTRNNNKIPDKQVYWLGNPPDL